MEKCSLLLWADITKFKEGKKDFLEEESKEIADILLNPLTGSTTIGLILDDDKLEHIKKLIQEGKFSRNMYDFVLGELETQIETGTLDEVLAAFANAVLYYNRVNKVGVPPIPDFVYSMVLDEIHGTKWLECYRKDKHGIVIYDHQPYESNIMYHKKEVIINRPVDMVSMFLLNNESFWEKQRFVRSHKIKHKLNKFCSVYHQEVSFFPFIVQSLSLWQYTKEFNGSVMTIGCSIDDASIESTEIAGIYSHLFEPVKGNKTKYTFLLKTEIRVPKIFASFTKKKFFVKSLSKTLKDLKKTMESVFQ